MNISIIIPVYHEEKNILRVLQQVQKKVKTTHEVIVVYDSPKDPTYTVLKEQKTYHIRLVKNKEQGALAAIKTGFSYAKGETVVVVVADLADDVGQIDEMYKKIKQGYDIVAASRYMEGGEKIGGTFFKSLLSKMAGLSLYYFFHLPTHDATNTYKMYRNTVLQQITIESTQGFVYSLEIVIKAYKMGFNITEIPTKWKDREEGKSHFKLRAWLPSYIKTYAKIFS